MPTPYQLEALAMDYGRSRYPQQRSSGNPPSGSRLTDLIMLQGQQQAEAAQRQGDIWGNAVQSIGQTVAGSIEKNAAEKKIKARDAAWLSVVGDPKVMSDPRAAYARALEIWGPEDGPKQFQGLAAAAQLSQPRRNPEADQKALGAVGAAYMGMDPATRPRLYPTLRQLAQGAVPGLEMPEQHDPEFDAKFVEPFVRQYAPAPRLTAVPAGGSLANEQGAIVSTAPSAPKEPKVETRSLDVQAAEALARGDTAGYNHLLQVRRDMSRADDKPPTPAGLSPTAESNIINRLTTQWTAASKSANELDRASNLMRAGMTAARRGDLAAGSQAVLVTFQKILDPTSVVRESEYARSASGQALLAQIEGSYERLTKGGAGVPLSELEKYQKLADEMVAGSRGHLDAVKARIGKTADRYKIPHETIFEDYDLGGPQRPPGGGPSGPRIGEVRAANGEVRRWNGSRWVRQ